MLENIEFQKFNFKIGVTIVLLIGNYQFVLFVARDHGLIIT